MRTFFCLFSIFSAFCLAITSFYAKGLVATGPYVVAQQAINNQPLGRIYALAQDSRGFLWIGTRNGLFRYDGFNALRFDKRNSALSSNQIQALMVDGDYLWLGTPSGLHRMHMPTRQISHYVFDVNNPNSIDANQVNALALAGPNKLWLATSRGINLFDGISGRNQRFNVQMEPRQTLSGQNVEVQSLLLDSRGNLWYSTNGQGLYQYQLASQTLNHYINESHNSHSIDSNHPDAIAEAGDGTIWVGTDVGLNRYRRQSDDFERIEVPIKPANHNRHVDVTSLLQDRDGRLWIGSSYNGVSLLLPADDRVVDVNPGGQDSHDMAVRFVDDILQDADGTLWFATATQGLVQVNRYAMHFNHLALPHDSDDKVRAVFVAADGVIWGALNKDLMRFEQGRWHKVKTLTDEGIIIAIAQDVDGQLVVAIGGLGVVKFDPVSGQLLPYGHRDGKEPTLPSVYLHSLHITSDGELWAGLFRSRGTPAGLYRFSRTHHKYQLMLSNTTVESVLAKARYVYVATRRRGLMIYDRDSDSWQRAKFDETGVSAIWQVFEDSQGRIWLASNGAGLGLLDPSDFSVSFVSSLDGLPSDSVRGIGEDGQGNLWLGTVSGVVWYNPQTQAMKIFDSRQGIKLGAVLPRAVLSASDTQLLLADNRQTLMFSSSELLSKVFTPVKPLPLMLSDLRLFNQPVSIADGSMLTRQINDSDSLVLSYQDYWLSLRFSSAYSSHLDDIRYAYKVDGLSERWVETDKNNRIASAILAKPGHYTLRVKSTDPQGKWQSTSRAIAITITPPWWLTWQAKGVYIALALLLMVAFYVYRTRALVNRAETLSQEVAARTATINRLMSKKEQMFANISHEFKTPLTLILTPLEALLQTRPGKEVADKVAMALRNGQRLLRMVEQLLELSRLDAMAQKHEHYYSLHQVLTVLLSSFDGLAAQKQLQIQCNEFDDVIVPSTMDALEIMLINLISNAIKYTPEGGRISIEVTPEPGYVTIVVKDSGVGISQDNQKLIFNRFTRASDAGSAGVEGAGIGLALVKELVESHQGTITLHSAPQQGSEFILRLPIAVGTDVEVEGVSDLSAITQHEIDVLGQLNTEVAAQPVCSEDTADERNKATVLLIDDNADMLRLLSDTLSREYQLLLANNGEAGLALAIEQVPDLIICDVMMPGISGFEVAARLKQESMTCHIPTVLLTAKGDVDSRMQGWAQDIDDYLAKPFHSQELLLRVKSLLSIRRILKKRFTHSDLQEAPDEQAQKAISDKDQAFLARFNEVLDSHFGDPEFNREQAASHMLISDHQLYRKLTALLDDNFTDLLRERRLQAALEMLKTGQQIAQIGDNVGFSSLPYFSKCFKARFGKTPKQYQKEVIV